MPLLVSTALPYVRYGFQYPLPTKKTLLSHCPPLKTEQLKIKGFSVKLFPTLPSARCFVSVGGNLYIEVYFFIGCPHIRSSCFIAIWIWGPNIVDVQTWYHRYIAPTFYIETSGRVMPYTFKPYDQNLNSHLLPLFISYRSSEEKLIKYHVNSSCVIMSVILMTTLFYKALILQGELWRWSLFGLHTFLARLHYFPAP